jgi:hypothetical protein
MVKRAPEIDFMRLFGFDAEDLSADRSRQLTLRQMSRLRRMLILARQAMHYDLS